MHPDDRDRYPPAPAMLRDGRAVLLRLLDSDDGKALADFYKSIPRETWRFYCPPRLTRADALQKASRALDPALVCLVAEDETTDRIVGYNWYTWQDQNSRASVFGICLRESHRGVGLGRALMTRLLTIAREIGPSVMSLTVQLANPRAVALYKKMEFQVMREQTRDAIGDFAAEPEYYMERRLR